MLCEKFSKNDSSYDITRDKYQHSLLELFNNNNNNLEKCIDFPKYAPNNSITPFLISNAHFIEQKNKKKCKINSRNFTYDGLTFSCSSFVLEQVKDEI